MNNIRFTHAEFSNKKKELYVEYSSGQKYSLHFGQLGINEKLISVSIDTATRGKSLILEFESGEIDYLPYDQPLHLCRDPEYLLQNQIENLSALINSELLKKGISKKFLARRLNTSENQIFRLLDPSILNKNLVQLSKVSALLGLEFEIQVRAA